MSNKKTYTNYPKKVGNEYYKNVREEIAEYFSKITEVVSVYEYGSVKAPGISDLDLILVFNDSCNEVDQNLLNLENIGKNAHDLVVDGTVIKMPESIFNQILFFDDLKFSKIYGKDIEYIEPSETERYYISLVSLIDWLPERILRIKSIFHSEGININNALCVLNSYCYSLIFLNNLIGKSLDSVKIINETNLLRSKWYSLKNPELRIYNLLRDSIKVGYKRINDYKYFLISSGNYLKSNPIISQETGIELHSGMSIKFISDNEQSNKVENSNANYINISSYFYSHFMKLADANGLLSDAIKNKIDPFIHLNSNFNQQYLQALNKKIFLANKNAEFLNKAGLSNGLIRYGFHFKQQGL
jgi:hypothetical protein